MAHPKWFQAGQQVVHVGLFLRRRGGCRCDELVDEGRWVGWVGRRSIGNGVCLKFIDIHELRVVAPIGLDLGATAISLTIFGRNVNTPAPNRPVANLGDVVY